MVEVQINLEFKVCLCSINIFDRAVAYFANLFQGHHLVPYTEFVDDAVAAFGAIADDEVTLQVDASDTKAGRIVVHKIAVTIV